MCWIISPGRQVSETVAPGLYPAWFTLKKNLEDSPCVILCTVKYQGQEGSYHLFRIRFSECTLSLNADNESGNVHCTLSFTVYLQ